MQRALQAHQEAELAEAARALLLNSNGNDSRDTFRQSLNGHGIAGGSSGFRADVFAAAGSSTARETSRGSSSGESARGTGAHTPLASGRNFYASTSQAIPMSFASRREHLDGDHNPPPGTLGLSPGPGLSNGSRHGLSSNYELGSSFVDSSLSASPFANANGNYTEILGGESDWIFATIFIVNQRT